ncbi:hypothetical protein [Mucilaginibacter sp.]|uniref:hypothetical protein n=1 Tax=Mucilaginibacter sp. TaxID=1882438 RepID=UPI0025DB5E28|nr:hypothetical protein [Mucilaginibacter sp.]
MVNQNPLQAILQQTGQKISYFTPSSRYYPIDAATIETADGRTVNYLRRRFIPPASSFYLLQYHTVVKDERLDNITSQYINDPTLFWQLCDANNVMDPDELTSTPGQQIRITLPQGIQGNR